MWLLSGHSNEKPQLWGQGLNFALFLTHRVPWDTSQTSLSLSVSICKIAARYISKIGGLGMSMRTVGAP